MWWDCFGLFKKKEKYLSLVVEESKPCITVTDPNDFYYQTALSISLSHIVPLAGEHSDGIHFTTEDKSNSWVVYHNTRRNELAYAIHLLHEKAKDNIRINFNETDTRKIHAAIREKFTLPKATL